MALTLGACAPLQPLSRLSSTPVVHSHSAIDRVSWDGGDASLERDGRGTTYRLTASNGAEAILSSSLEPPHFDHLALVQGRPVAMVAVHDNVACPNALTAYELNGRFWNRYQLGNCGTTVTYESTPTGLIVREQIRANHNHAVWTLNNEAWDVQSEFASAADLRAANVRARASAQAKFSAAKPYRSASRARLQAPSAVGGSSGTVDASRYQAAPGHLSLGNTP